MELFLRDGRKLSGTPEEITRLLAMSDVDVGMGEYGDETYYKSESKGLIPIKEMNSVHLQRSICKIYREWTSEVLSSRLLSIEDFFDCLESGPTDKTVLAMVKELGLRTL